MEAVRSADAYGCLPLHRASGRADEEVVELLLRVYPEGVGRRECRAGWLPLHHAVACAGAPAPDVIRLLLEEGFRQGVGGEVGEGGVGGGSLEADRRGETPLEIACTRFLDVAAHIDDYDADELDSAWEVVAVLARAATSSAVPTGSMGDGGRLTLPTLHAVIEAGCYKDIILCTISMTPEETSMRDHRGRTALAIVASKPEWADEEVVKQLLSYCHSGCVAARMADRDRHLPLHIAAESGWNYEGGLELLHHAEPRALSMQDEVTRLYPFMLAAVGPNSNLDSSFNLLRADPSLVLGRMMVRDHGMKKRKR